MKYLATFILLILIFNNISAAERKEICAVYTNTGKKYKVTGTQMTGDELNSATSTFNYSFYSYYMIIFWNPSQATIIKMNSPFGVSEFDTNGNDQNGYEWRVSTNTSFCQ